MIRPIYIYGSEILRKRAAEADLGRREELEALIQDLKDTLVHADGGGLAAPQIGVGLRVVIVDAAGLEDTYDYLKGFKRVLVNPVITEESAEKTEYSEGCLSLPGIYCDVLRPARITVEKVTETFDKFGCRMIQHELSHLDGDLFIDHVAPIRRKMLAKKLQKMAKGKVSAGYGIALK